MRYRIRYTKGSASHTAEVEANSPNEAVVKFRHVEVVHDKRPPAMVQITSVCTDEPPDPAEW